jgi:hypothetical protein
VHDIELAENRGGIVRENHLLQVVDDDLVAAIGSERCLYGRGDGSAGVDVADDGAIFSIIASEELSVSLNLVQDIVKSLLLVARLEQPRVGRIRY